MESFIICEGKKYIIENDDIYKILNGDRRKPTKNELCKVKNIIENINKDIFISPKLNELAKKNKELYRIDILPEILERMEKFIGEEYIESFYKNLETVKFEFDNPIECIKSDSKETGYHDGMNNIIHINAETFDYIEKFSEENKLDFNLVWKIALAHELFHLASCNNRYNETGYIYKGLNEVNYNKKRPSLTDEIKQGIALSFTEGITQLFACFIYYDDLGKNNLNKFNNSYTYQARVIGQLAPMIGYKEIKNAYFKNLGISYINDKLLQIDKRKLLYDQLSTNMGRLISNKSSESVKNTSVVKIQSVLLQYEVKYFDMMDKENIEEFVDGIRYFFIGLWNDMNETKISDETKSLVEENLLTFEYLKEKRKTYIK